MTLGILPVHGLQLCVIIIVCTVTGAVLLRGRLAWMRLAWNIGSLAALTATMASLIGSPLDPHFQVSEGGLLAEPERLVLAAWWILVARTAILTGHAVLRTNRQHHGVRLAADLAAGMVYLGALIAIADLVFGVSIPGLVATSGVIAIVLGLALQNTLGDVFSGIAVGLDRPFGVGDYIWIDGAAEGRVIETNWRATRITTDTNDVATVPNSVIAKSRILNRSSPSEARKDTLRIILDALVPPDVAIRLLRAALLNVEGLLTPTPSVLCTDLYGRGANYNVTFTAALDDLPRIRSEVLVQVARHTRFAGVALASPDAPPPARAAAPSLDDMLGGVAVLQMLSADERARLTSGLVARHGTADTAVVTQGGAVFSLFIIAQGAFEVRQDRNWGAARLGSLGPGDTFGETALLTGAPNEVTVTAMTDFLVYELSNAVLAPLLQENPDLLHRFERDASRLHEILASKDSIHDVLALPSPQNLIGRICAFFDVTASKSRETSPDRDKSNPFWAPVAKSKLPDAP